MSMQNGNGAVDLAVVSHTRSHSTAVGNVIPFADPGLQPSIPESEATLQDLIKILRKRRRLIAVITIASFAFAWGYCMVTPKMYTASSTLEIKGYAPILATAAVESQHGLDTRKLEYQKTTMAKLKRMGTAEAVLKDEKLAKEVQAYFQSKPSLVRTIKGYLGLSSSSDKDEVKLIDTDEEARRKTAFIKSYMSLLDINPIHETSLVEITATTRVPALSQMIANEHAKGFIERVQEERKESVTSSLKALQSQADELKEKVTAAERRLIQYAEQNELVTLSKSGGDNPVVNQIINLSKLLADATAKRISSESLLREVEKSSLTDSTALDDESVRQLRVALKEAETEYATLGRKVTPAYPGMIELKAKINVLKRSIDDERRQTLRGLRSQFESDLSAERKLSEQIQSLEGKAHDLSKRLIQYNVLQREAESLRGLYQAVLKQLEETEIGSATGASNIVVSDLAGLPHVPSAPLTSMILVLGLVLGVVAGVALAFILELLDNTIGTSEELQTALNMPFLGGVPTFTAGKGYFKQEAIIRLGTVEVPDEGKDAKLAEASKKGAGSPVVDRFVTITSPHATVSEALRTIRAGILLSSVDNPSRVILVTSANKGEGKTTIVSNLAVTLAQANHRTLLIDADLRQSSVHTLFNLSDDRPGLVDVLAGQATIEQAIHETVVTNLDVITAGSIAPNPAELVGSNKMRQTIELLKEKYDYILIDTPPVIPVADALMLSRSADSVVLVVRSLQTEKTLAQDAARRLQRVSARILGVVLNDVDVEKVGYSSKRIATSYYYR